MNTIAKYFLNTVLGLEHLEVEINSEGINGGVDSQYDGNKINKRYQFAKEISQKDAKDAIVVMGENVKGSIMSISERKNFVEIAKTHITNINYKQIRKEYINSSEGKNFDKSKNNFVNVISWKLQQTLGDVLQDADINATYKAINDTQDKFLFLVGLYQILSNDYEQGVKKSYDKVDTNDKRINGDKIDFNLVDFIAGPVLLKSLNSVKQDLDDLNMQIKTTIGETKNTPTAVTNTPPQTDKTLNNKLMDGAPNAKNNPIPAKKDTVPTEPETETSKEKPKQTPDQIINTPATLKTETKTEIKESAVTVAPVTVTPAPIITPEADLTDGDKSKKEIRREKKLDKSQEKSTETLTNESYSGKRIQKASEEIIVQAIQETLEGNNNVGDATGLSKVLTTIQNEHEKKAKSLDAVSREDQDKLITNKEKRVKSNEDKLMDVNDSATAKILNNTKDEISGLNKKGTELEAIRVSTDAKETERTNALNKANSEEKASDKINWFNKANVLRGEVKTEKMKEVKNIQDKTTKVSDYYKGHLDAVNKSALIFQNRVKRYEKAVNSITTSLDSYAQQFQKNVDQKQLSASISEDASGNVVYPDGFDNFLNLPTTIGASATKQLYNKVLENSNTELRAEINYLYLKLTGITNSENTDVTTLDLTEKEGEDNYNTILAQSQKSLGVIEAEKSNLQSIYKTGPDGYIMIKGNQEADMKEYEILYSEFSTLTQEYLKGEKEYNDKATDSEAQSKLLWDSSTGRRMQYKTWINEVAARMNDLVGNKAESADTASAVLAKNSNYSDTSSINYLYPPSDTSSLSTLTTGKIGTANTLLRTFDGQENNKLPYELTNPVKKSVLELGEDISNNTNIDYKMVAKDYKSYIEDQGRQ